MRVKYKTIWVTEVEVGDVLVVQDAIIREDGSHKLTVTKVTKDNRHVWLTFAEDNGNYIRYWHDTKVNLGIKY